MKHFNIPGLAPGTAMTRFVDIAPSSYSKKNRTVECVISVGSPVHRSYGVERLRISADAVDLSRLGSAGIPLLDSHNQHGIDNALGRFTEIWIGRSNGKTALLGRITFNDTVAGRKAEGMVARGEVSGVSAGYTVSDWEIRDASGNVLDPEVDRIPFDQNLTFEAVRWALLETSLVTVPADQEAIIRSHGGQPQSTASAALARMHERQRQHDAGYQPETISTEPKMSFEVIRDEREGVADAMQIALTQRILASRSSTVEYVGSDRDEKAWLKRHRAQAQSYLDMGIVELAATHINYRGRSKFLRVSDASEILYRAFQSTSDFPNIFMNALNKALLARYQLSDPTYKKIAAERTFNDYRPHPQIRAGDFPMLQPVLETGELAYATSTDNGESISVNPYGIVFSISRQMLVNDDLGAIDQILASAGQMVTVFENTTFFNMMLSNAGVGPTLAQDNTAVFAAGHNNLVATGSGAAPSVATIGAARQMLRQQKSTSGNFLNVPPKIILTGPQQETAADQAVASITPTLAANVNPFSGRLDSVSDANITDSSWFIATDPAQVPNFVYGFLNGQNGPRTRTFEPFGVQGLKVSLEHDFGVGAIDFRGMVRNAGN